MVATNDTVGNEQPDIIPETVDDALAKWDAGETVFTVEMGGIGPGYEQCIQVLAFELMRVWKDEPWPAAGADMLSEQQARLKDLAEPVIGRLNETLGFSGAQVGAAQNLAACVCRHGYRAALRDPAVADRLIQVSNKFPH